MSPCQEPQISNNTQNTNREQFLSKVAISHQDRQQDQDSSNTNSNRPGHIEKSLKLLDDEHKIVDEKTHQRCSNDKIIDHSGSVTVVKMSQYRISDVIAFAQV